jgi:proline iminopeptidase
MNNWYPSIDPYAEHWIRVGRSHRLYVEESGRPDGASMLFLHGGPGSGSRPDHRRYFDPDYYRVIVLDQRGSGRSTPLGETAENTTARLVQDLETVRARLKIGRWSLFGGSWGATLALVYAQTHPEAVAGMVLRGTFLGRPEDLLWCFSGQGVARVLPEAWQAFIEAIPAGERGSPIRAYHQRVHGGDPGTALCWARAWSAWTDRVVTWNLPATGIEQERDQDPEATLAKVRIETHYALNRYFIVGNPILSRVDRLPPVPTTIVHGRRDLTCTLESSWTLHRKVRGSRLVIVSDAGHIASEPAMIRALVAETDRLRVGRGG